MIVFPLDLRMKPKKIKMFLAICKTLEDDSSCQDLVVKHRWWMFYVLSEGNVIKIFDVIKIFARWHIMI
jgi:hypothetical protein